MLNDSGFDSRVDHGLQPARYLIIDKKVFPFWCQDVDEPAQGVPLQPVSPGLRIPTAGAVLEVSDPPKYTCDLTFESILGGSPAHLCR